MKGHFHLKDLCPWGLLLPLCMLLPNVYTLDDHTITSATDNLSRFPFIIPSNYKYFIAFL